jgi:cytochrome P450
MLKETIAARFAQDPLQFLDEQFPGNGDAVRTGHNEYLLGNPVDARAVLSNNEGRYGEHSDFFHTRYGSFGPRSTQLKIRRAARLLVRSHLQARDQGELSSFMAANLPLVSDWPDTGNRLTYRFLSPILLAPDGPPKLRNLLDRIVEQAVLANARSRQPRWRRMLLQFNTTLQLSKAIEARQALAREQPLDLLDVVACSAEPGQRIDELVEVFLSFLFAVAGSVGFVLGWSLYLSGMHPDRKAPPEWVVQEALRLWPVAWQLGRHPTKDHEISGMSVSTTDEVVVCPYLVHRNPQYWSEPTSFQPQRWSTPDAWRNPAFIPFGYGPHRCVAADLSSQLISAMLGEILRSNTLSIEAHETRPTVAAAMAPPPFRMTLRPRG